MKEENLDQDVFQEEIEKAAKKYVRHFDIVYQEFAEVAFLEGAEFVKNQYKNL
ncbi:MAG: hypothetical protein WC827_03635 [Candidatus Paceibacterota bacterium]|jgi:hypothetical protein